MLISPQRWQPDRGWVWAQLAAAALLLALIPFVDRLGWVMLSPVLTADAEGIAVVDGVHRVAVGWERVERLRTVRDRRTPLLELDLGEHVVVLSRRRLGAPVDEVLGALEELRVS